MSGTAQHWGWTDATRKGHRRGRARSDEAGDYRFRDGAYVPLHAEPSPPPSRRVVQGSTCRDRARRAGALGSDLSICRARRRVHCVRARTRGGREPWLATTDAFFAQDQGRRVGGLDGGLQTCRVGAWSRLQGDSTGSTPRTHTQSPKTQRTKSRDRKRAGNDAAVLSMESRVERTTLTVRFT